MSKTRIVGAGATGFLVDEPMEVVLRNVFRSFTMRCPAVDPQLHVNEVPVLVNWDNVLMVHPDGDEDGDE